MDYATSIRHGGQLIDAEKCDYNDYKDLQLLCPECKEPVHLIKESIRHLIDKDVVIAAHFSHFCSGARFTDCENRVRQYNQNDIDVRIAQAKNQRLEVFNSHFWQLFLNNCKLLGTWEDGVSPEMMQGYINDFLSPDGGLIFTTQFAGLSQEEIDKFYQEYIADSKLDLTTDDPDILFEENIFREVDFHFISPLLNFDINYKKDNFNNANVKLAEAILLEIAGFLCAKSSRILRLNCLAFGIIRCTLSRGSCAKWFSFYLTDDKTNLWKLGLSVFVRALVKIDWGEVLSTPIEDICTEVETEELTLESMKIDNLYSDSETQQKVQDALTLSGLSLPEFIQKACVIYANTLIGKAEQLDADLSIVPTKELLESKYNTHPERAREMVKRAIQAIKLHNSELVAHPWERWHINQTAIQSLTGSRPETVKEILTDYQDDINIHNKDYNLTVYTNRKADKRQIEDVINIADLVPNGIDQRI